MKVLIDSSCERHGEGIASSMFWVPETEAIVWLSNTKPLMDMFDETKPDIVIADWLKFTTAEMPIASQRYPNTKLVALGGPKTNPSRSYPFLSPDLMISDHGIDGTPHIPFRGGSMIGAIGNPPPEENLQTDILCLTDYITNLEGSMKAIKFLCDNYNIKIFGKHRVNVPHYLGQLDGKTKAAALASTTAYVDLDGHSWYDAAWLGRQCISISLDCFNSFSLHDQQSLKDAVDRALSTSPKHTTEEIRLMVKNQTYFELTNEILSFFNLTTQRNQLIDKKRELLC